MLKKFLVVVIIITSFLIMAQGTKALFSDVEHIPNNTISTADSFSIEHDENQVTNPKVPDDTENEQQTTEPPISYSLDH